jgi:hypothetical protein
MSKKAIFSSILALAVILGGSYMWLSSGQFRIGRASVTIKDISVENSYVFVTPIRSKANNDEKIRLTVFVLNSQGLGVLGQKVTISSDPSLVPEAIQGITDNFGKAIYDISATKAGEYYLDVTVGSQLLPQKAHLSYY